LGERRTASASGLTPFSIRETQYESCWRLRCVFCPVKEYSQLPIPRSRAARAIQMGWETCKGTGTGGGHTSSVAISCRMSMTSRAAWRLSTSGAGGMAGVGENWCYNGGGIRMRSLAVSHVLRAPRMQTGANICKHQVRIFILGYLYSYLNMQNKPIWLPPIAILLYFSSTRRVYCGRNRSRISRDLSPSSCIFP